MIGVLVNSEAGLPKPHGGQQQHPQVAPQHVLELPPRRLRLSREHPPVLEH